MANHQRNNEQVCERIEEQANVRGGNIPEAEPTGRKILGRAGGGVKVNSSTQTLPDTRGVDNAWLNDSRIRADALCEEILNLINRLYHATGNPRNYRHSIPKTPQKKSANSGNRRRSVGEVPPHETEEDRRAAAERRFYFEIRRDMSGISNSAIYLRNSIPLPRPDEEQRFPSPESPPVLLPIQGLAEASAPPLEQHQEDMAASGFQRDITSGLAYMTLEESTEVDQENSSADSKGKKTPRRKPLRNSPTEGHVPQQRSPLLYKSPHPSSPKPHTKRVKSAQKASGKDNGQQPCTSATGRQEAVNTGMLGARPKISSTSVWGKGYTASSTPHGVKQSAVSPTSTTPIAQSTSLASGVIAASIGASASQDSRVTSRATTALGIASSQSSASDIVKEAASKATSATLRELRGIRGGVYQTDSSQKSSATGGSCAGSSSQTSSGEPSQYQRTSTKSIERPRPASHASDSMGKKKAPKAPTFTSRETRGIPGVLKGTNIECVLMGKAHSSLAPKVSSGSSRRDTRGVTRELKEAATGRISKVTYRSQASSKSGTSSSSQMSSSESGKSRRTNERPLSRQVSDAVGKKKAMLAPKFTSTAGRENLGVSGVLKGTNIECVLKGGSRTSPASRNATTPRSETSGATSGGNSSIGVATGVTSTVSMDAATTSLPKGDTVTSLPKGYSSIESPKVASATRVPKRSLSDQASNVDARTGSERTTMSNPDDMSLGLLRPRLPYLVTDPTPGTLSRRASDLTDKKPTSQTLKKKPHSY